MALEIDELIQKHALEQRAPFYAWMRFLATLSITVLAVSVSIQNTALPMPDGFRRKVLLFTWALLLISGLLAWIRAAGEFHDHRRFRDHLLAMRRRNLSDEEIRRAIIGGEVFIGATFIENAIGRIAAVSFVLGLAGLMLYAATAP